jgi:hypothetical protein
MPYFRNVQYHGVWVAGGTYSFEVWAKAVETFSPQTIHWWDLMPLPGNQYVGKSVLFQKDYEFPVPPLDKYGSSTFDPDAVIENVEVVSESSGNLTSGFWRLLEVEIPPDLPEGKYKLVHCYVYGYYDGSWHWSGTSYEEYEITILPVGAQLPPEPVTPTIPDTRPVDYDNDLYWVPGEWVDDVYTPPHWDEAPLSIVAAGGGRWNQNLVVAGHNLIYYEEYS